MARDHARIYVSIWNDPAFRARSRAAQHGYFTLLSQPRMSYCGVLDYMPVRLAQFAADINAEDVEKAVEELEEHRFVVLDRSTGELLVRSYVRHDGLLSQPNVVKAMVRDIGTVMSLELRAAIVAELRRARREDPALKGWATIAEAFPELHRELGGKSSRKGSAKGCPNP